MMTDGKCSLHVKWGNNVVQLQPASKTEVTVYIVKRLKFYLNDEVPAKKSYKLTFMYLFFTGQ